MEIIFKFWSLIGTFNHTYELWTLFVKLSTAAFSKWFKLWLQSGKLRTFYICDILYGTQERWLHFTFIQKSPTQLVCVDVGCLFEECVYGLRKKMKINSSSKSLLRKQATTATWGRFFLLHSRKPNVLVRWMKTVHVFLVISTQEDFLTFCPWSHKAFQMSPRFLHTEIHTSQTFWEV